MTLSYAKYFTQFCLILVGVNFSSVECRKNISVSVKWVIPTRLPEDLRSSCHEVLNLFSLCAFKLFIGLLSMNKTPLWLCVITGINMVPIKMHAVF